MLELVPGIVLLAMLLGTVAVLESPEQQRRAVLSYLFGISAWLIYLDDRWVISGIRIMYLGFALGGFGLLGLFGVNIWARGPLDPRMDRESDPIGETESDLPPPDARS